MSLFKEKDDFITKAFLNQFNHDDSDKEEPEQETDLDESQELMAEQSSASEPTNIDIIPPAIPTIKTESLNHECIELDFDGDEFRRKTLDSIIDIRGESIDDGGQIITLSSSDDDEVTALGSSNSVTNKSFQRMPNPKRNQNTSQDTDDDDYNLKLTLAGSYKQFCTTYKTPLYETLKGLLSDLSSRGKGLIVIADAKTVSLEESPYSLGLKPGVILAGFETVDPSASNPNEITVKLQDGNRKHTKEYRIIKNEPLLRLKQLYARDFEIESIDSIKLCFDGDVIEDESTPEELDIEDDCIIDVMFF